MEAAEPTYLQARGADGSGRVLEGSLPTLGGGRKGQPG